jgi:hypothetical protein
MHIGQSDNVPTRIGYADCQQLVENIPNNLDGMAACLESIRVSNKKLAARIGSCAPHFRVVILQVR